MATLTHDAPAVSVAHPLSGARSLLARFQAWRALRREYAQAMHDLVQIDTRDLRDLGISQYDFESIARGTFRR